MGSRDWNGVAKRGRKGGTFDVYWASISLFLAEIAGIK